MFTRKTGKRRNKRRVLSRRRKTRKIRGGVLTPEELEQKIISISKEIAKLTSKNRTPEDYKDMIAELQKELIDLRTTVKSMTQPIKMSTIQSASNALSGAYSSLVNTFSSANASTASQYVYDIVNNNLNFAKRAGPRELVMNSMIFPNLSNPTKKELRNMSVTTYEKNHKLIDDINAVDDLLARLKIYAQSGNNEKMKIDKKQTYTKRTSIAFQAPTGGTEPTQAPDAEPAQATTSTQTPSTTSVETQTPSTTSTQTKTPATTSTETQVTSKP